MAAQSPPGPPPGPPYAPPVAILGGIPTVSVDVPTSAVFLLLFVLGAAAHFVIFQVNRKQAHMFFLSMVMFGFCMCRIVTTSLRIAWATDEQNVSLGLAAQIFVAVGTVLLYIVNLIFTQRIIRAQHPNWGWHRAFDAAFRVLIVATILTLIMLITVTIQSFFTLSTNTHRIDRDVQHYGSTFFTFVAFLPLPLLLVGIILPRRVRVEKFGIGRFRTKIIVLATAALLLTLGAGWRCGTSWVKPVPRSQSPWYLDKACFYVFDFGIEVIVIFLYAFIRVDRRFFVPSGAKGPGGYRAGTKHHAHQLVPSHPLDAEKQGYTGYASYEAGYESPLMFDTLRIYSEEELFDDTATLAETLKYSQTSLQLDDRSGKWMLKRQSTQSLYSNASQTVSMYGSSRSVPIPDSHIYSPLDYRPNASGDPTTAHIAGDVQWETISMSNTHEPSLVYSDISSTGDQPFRPSMASSIERPERARRETWSSLASERLRPHSGVSQKPTPTTTTGSQTLEKKKSAEKGDLKRMSLASSRSEKRRSGERGASDDKQHSLPPPQSRASTARGSGEQQRLMPAAAAAVEQSPPYPGRERKSSWRKSVESSLRMSLQLDGFADEDAIAEEEEKDAAARAGERAPLNKDDGGSEAKDTATIKIVSNRKESMGGRSEAESEDEWFNAEEGRPLNERQSTDTMRRIPRD